MKFASVTFPISRSLTLVYGVPPELSDRIKIGHPIKVPLGKSIKTGIISNLSNVTNISKSELKFIIDIDPLISPIPEELLGICHWTCQYYLCSLGQVLKLFINKSTGKPKRTTHTVLCEKERRTRTKTAIPTEEQKKALSSIDMFLNTSEHKGILLYGVTGSGKTIIYMQLIKKILKSGRSILVLVPEIGLTGPFWRTLQSATSEPVGVLHSNMSRGQRAATWESIAAGKIKIAIGTRSAVWAPLNNLGLIIVDEEHDSSFKQNEGIPRYNARDVAVYRAAVNRIPIVLGSATPSFESWHNAKTGKYHLVELLKRYGKATLPKVQIVDMTAEHASGNWGFLSTLLAQSISDRLDKKEQIILLLNRRGYSPVLMCRSCGHVVKCPNCDISLTYHSVENRAKCHYCGHGAPAPSTCPACSGTDLKHQGVGVQRLEKEISKRFQQARIERLDLDTTRRRNAHDNILDRFGRHEIDILIGTKMVAKGLDFQNVTLVGIIAADTGLNMPDFRASELTFQLLSQVSGRSGRGDKPGEVVLQTYNPNEPSIIWATRHNFRCFYETEAETRKTLQYPPFSRIIQITLSHTNKKTLLMFARKLVTIIRNRSNNNINILGPAPAPIERQKNKYRHLIMLKSARPRDLHVAVRDSLEEARSGSVQVVVDVDPIFML